MIIQDFLFHIKTTVYFLLPFCVLYYSIAMRYPRQSHFISWHSAVFGMLMNIYPASWILTGGTILVVYIHYIHKIRLNFFELKLNIIIEHFFSK